MVLALDRSDRVNHRVSRRSIAGKMKLSAMPSRNRSRASTQNWRTTPVSAARTPQTISETKTSRVALRLRARMAPGTWKQKYPKKKIAPSSELWEPVMWSVAARPAAAPKP